VGVMHSDAAPQAKPAKKRLVETGRPALRNIASPVHCARVATFYRSCFIATPLVAACAIGVACALLSVLVVPPPLGVHRRRDQSRRLRWRSARLGLLSLALPVPRQRSRPPIRSRIVFLPGDGADRRLGSAGGGSPSNGRCRHRHRASSVPSPGGFVQPRGLPVTARMAGAPPRQRLGILTFWARYRTSSREDHVGPASAVLRRCRAHPSPSSPKRSSSTAWTPDPRREVSGVPRRLCALPVDAHGWP